MINPFSIFHKKKETENETPVSENKPLENKNTIGKYKVYIKLNGKEIESTTDDLKSTIMSAKPKLALKTRVLMKIEREDGKKFEQFILTPRARLIFTKESYLDLFIRKLIFK